jgi:hypothetical protein
MPFMSSYRSFALATLLTGLSGCAALPTGSGSTSVSADTPRVLSGELTSRSPVNVSDGTRYQSFVLQLEAGQILEARVQQPFEGHLSLLDEQMQLINGPRLNVLSLSPQHSGRYQLNLSGDSATRFGPFSLRLSPIQVRNSGTLGNTERLAGLLQGKGSNSYQLNVSEPAIYRISLSSDEFDTVLKLSGEGLKLENDDDDAGGTHSRIDSFLQPGQYTLEVAGIDGDSSGVYVLSSEQRDLPTGVDLRNSGLLEPDSPITGLGSQAPLSYQLRVAEPALVTLNMSSGEIDSHLTLKGRGIEAADDDGADNGRDARLTQLLEAGEYEVVASSVSSASGLFSLSYSSTPVRKGELSGLRAGQYADGTLRQESPQQARLYIAEAGTYQLDLASSDFDAYLQLKGGELDLEDDDSGGGRNARLSTQLDSGEYDLEIRAVDSGSRGRFRISVIRQP